MQNLFSSYCIILIATDISKNNTNLETITLNHNLLITYGICML